MPGKKNTLQESNSEQVDRENYTIRNFSLCIVQRIGVLSSRLITSMKVMLRAQDTTGRDEKQIQHSSRP